VTAGIRKIETQRSGRERRASDARACPGRTARPGSRFVAVCCGASRCGRRSRLGAVDLSKLSGCLRHVHAMRAGNPAVRPSPVTVATAQRRWRYGRHLRLFRHLEIESVFASARTRLAVPSSQHRLTFVSHIATMERRLSALCNPANDLRLRDPRAQDELVPSDRAEFSSSREFSRWAFHRHVERVRVDLTPAVAPVSMKSNGRRSV